MKKILILADIHANIHALDAVLETLSAHELAAIYCAGDIVGYGVYPNECVERLRELGAICIRGNHDRFVVGLDDGSSFNGMAYEAGLLTREMLSAESRDYLLGLSDECRVDDNTLIAHGAPGDPDRYLFGSRELSDAAENLQREEGPGLCIVGHTHVPAFADPDHAFPSDKMLVMFDDDRRIMINPGSVGQPRDGSPAAAYALVEMESGTILFNRVTYNHEEVAVAVSSRGMPSYLAYRLLIGV
jgi:predicted phosphodiesterase